MSRVHYQHHRYTICLVFMVVMYLANIYFVLNGLDLVDKWINPWIVFITGFAVGFLYLYLKKRNHISEFSVKPIKWRRGLWGLGIGFISIAITYGLFKTMLIDHDPDSNSDIMRQIEALYTRYTLGENPYYLVNLETHSPYPVYMPMHWMPLFITDILNVDSRWISFISLSLAMSLIGFGWAQRAGQLSGRFLVAIILPTLPLWGFLLWEWRALAVNIEPVVVSYYLVLSYGLLSRNIHFIILGLLLCLLSRYTLVFWLPLFAILFLYKRGLLASTYLWLTIGIGVLAVYIIPFLLDDPHIFMNGVQYHNRAAVGEWVGYGSNHVSYSMEKGISFAGHFKAWMTAEMVDRVYLARKFQGGMMLLLLVAGLIGYYKFNKRISIYHYSLAFLYIVILFFYLFGPLTYLYYMILPMTLSGVLVADIILDWQMDTQ